jgi:hypothetical protein
MHCPDCERVAEETGGVTTRCLAHQRVEVTDWPKPRVSNPNFLSGLLADWQADQKRPE